MTITLCAASCLLQSEHLVRFPGAPPFPSGGRDFAGPGPLDRLYEAADGWVRLSAGPDAGLSELQAAGLAVPGDAVGDADLAAMIAAAVASLPARKSCAVQRPRAFLPCALARCRS